MKIKCQIKWIGADGKPTPDTNDAVMMAYVHKLYRLNPLTSLPEYTEEILQSFPICAAHYATVTNKLRYPVGAWSFTNLNSMHKMKIKELIQAYARAKQNSKYRGATMQTDEMITEIASFGFGVYSTSNSIIIADPDDDANGFGIECSTLEEAYKEWDAAWALRDNS